MTKAGELLRLYNEMLVGADVTTDVDTEVDEEETDEKISKATLLRQKMQAKCQRMNKDYSGAKDACVPPCRPGMVRDTATGDCQKKLKPCMPGQMRDPVTDKCRPMTPDEKKAKIQMLKADRIKRQRTGY